MSASSDTPVVSVRSLRKERRHGSSSSYALEVPRLDVLPGERLLITGPSGSGKSTLLDLIGLVLKPDAVERFSYAPLPRARLRDAEADAAAYAYDVADSWRRGRVEQLARWRRSIGYVLQTGGLLPFISVKENIFAPRALLGLPHDDLPDTLIAALGIQPLLQKLPAALSVGERQRVAIARALAAHPSLVLADEPTAALDPANAAAVMELFAHMTRELGVTLILVSHAPGLVRGMGFRRLHVALQPFEEKNGLTGTRAVLTENGRDGNVSPSPHAAAAVRPDKQRGRSCAP